MSDLREQLQEIRSKHGKLTPVLVVDEARDESSPLHHHFDWDNDDAAESWRKEQARLLIKSVRITYEVGGKDHSVRAFHAIRQEHLNEPVYEPSEVVATDPMLREIVLRQMERDWESLHARYGMFREFVELVQMSMKNAA